MSETPARQHKDGGVSHYSETETGRETLKSLARKVLKQAVSAVSPLGSETARQSTPDTETPVRQLRDSDELSASCRRLAGWDIRLAVFITDTDAGLRVTGERMLQGESAERKAVAGGAVVFSANEMLVFVSLNEAQRRQFLSFKLPNHNLWRK